MAEENLTGNDLLEKNDWLDKIKDSSNSVEEQVDLIIKSIQAPKQSYEAKQIVFQEVSDICKQFDPVFSVEPNAGCYANELALKCCTVTLAIKYNRMKTNDPNSVDKMKEFISKSQKNFIDVKEIKSRFSTTKLQFNYSGLRFKLEFNNELKLHHRALVEKFLLSEKKFKKLLLLIKLFVKKHMNGSCKLATFPLCLLIFFYLQQKFEVNGICDSMNCNGNMLGGWYMEVSTLKGFDKLPIRKSSVLELLKGFFEYYAIFDFKSYAICTFVGEPIRKWQLYSRKALPAQYRLLKADLDFGTPPDRELESELCVQDPFVHTLNLTRHVSADFMMKINTAFKEAANVFKKNDGDTFLNLFKFKLE